MGFDSYDVLSLLLGVIFFIGSAIYPVAQARWGTAFSWKTYTKWLVLAVAMSALAAPMYFIASPINISLADAYMLRQLHVGWRHVFVAYCFLAGILLGGLIAWAMLRK